MTPKKSSESAEKGPQTWRKCWVAILYKKLSCVLKRTWQDKRPRCWQIERGYRLAERLEIMLNRLAQWVVPLVVWYARSIWRPA